MSAKPGILIVEDDFLMGMELNDLLEDKYDVSKIVTTGEEAIEHVNFLNPELILMDIRLKGEINGIETARQIRKSFDMPIIFLTGYKDEETLLEVKKIKNSFFLTKPLNPLSLLDTIKDSLRINKQ